MGPLDAAMPPTPVSHRKRTLLIAGVVIAALIPVVQSTFAANVDIGSGSIEFGQGYQAVAACDNSITITPSSAFSGTAFTVSQVVISNVDLTACNGKTFTLRLRKSDNSVETNGEIVFVLDSTNASTPVGISSSGSTNLKSTSTASSSTITVIPTTEPEAANITKLTLETN